jgi:hypothetical protein
MTPIPSTTSLRGEQTKYFVYRSDLPDWEDPEADYTKDVASLNTSELSEVGMYVSAILATALWRYDFGIPGFSENLCMTYNPITDQYSIRPGTYVL